MPRVRVAVVLIPVLVGAAWLSGGARPFADALVGALRPTDFTRDYVAAHAFVHRGGPHDPPLEGDAANDYAEAIGARRVELLGAPYAFHPPPSLLLILPLVPLGYRGAAVAWLLLSLAALGWLAYVLVAIVDGKRPPRAVRFAGAYALLALWPPVLHNLAKGQWSVLLAALMAGGWSALARDRPRAGGVWLGVAASLKAVPIVLLGYLVLRRRGAAVAKVTKVTTIAMLATIAALAAVSAAVEGPSAWRTWLSAGPAEVAVWQTWTANTASLHALFARLFAGGPFAHPVVHAPALALGLTAAVSALLVAAAALATVRARPEDEPRLFAAWCLLVLLLNPLGWSHSLVMGLLPLALCGRTAAAAAALVIWSVPRDTLAAWAAGTPGAVVGALVGSLHALAALALFAVALAGTTTERAGAWKTRIRG